MIPVPMTRAENYAVEQQLNEQIEQRMQLYGETWGEAMLTAIIFDPFSLTLLQRGNNVNNRRRG